MDLEAEPDWSINLKYSQRTNGGLKNASNIGFYAGGIHPAFILLNPRTPPGIEEIKEQQT